MRRRLLRASGLGAGAILGGVVAWASGCAAIAGLDQTYNVVDGAAAGDGSDATVTDGGDSGPLTDSASRSDAGAVDGASPYAAGWQVDQDFGQAGWVMLNQAVSAAAPVITTEDGGFLDLAAGSTDGGVLLGIHLDPADTTQALAATSLGGAVGTSSSRAAACTC